MGPLRVSASAVTSTVPILAPDGSAAAPSWSFSSGSNAGAYYTTNQINYTASGAKIAQLGTGYFDIMSDTGRIGFGSAVDVSLSRGAADVLTTPDRFVSTGPTAGIGYATGAGGTQTQLTSKATTVVLNTITGEVTMHNATLNAAASVSFTLTNSAIALGDYVMVQHISAGTLGAYVCQAIAAAGSAAVTVTNRSAGNLGEAIVLKFLVLKAATS